ncbi:hypothetical protein PDESU_01637 [Pontiella desulfatans]|uniref:PEP-CTERM protein-sorting domain-containing protein n=1 Tax=Pontiella desulfatans TaxID=2750659 RepID=A0A6C2TZQ1_PONDE|nr:PEP-CTERM sorting domain-containing protein [Pontiella desulfatans]VGO13083.1 hypothetical protein PDESU_01637 [Pontiella desulfatans]
MNKNVMTAVVVGLSALWASADITLNMQGDNINDDKNGLIGVVNIDAAGLGSLSQTGALNFPGTGTTAAPVSGSVSAGYAGIFQVRVNTAIFDNNTGSATFGYNIGNAKTDAAASGLGIVDQSGVNPSGAGIGGLAASNVWEGAAFSLGTDSMAAGSKLQLTEVTLSNFDYDSGESVYILNNMSGDFLQINAAVVASEGVRVATIDVSSLDIVVDAGQALPAYNSSQTGNQTFSIITAAEASNGYRIESTSYNVIPEPATIGLLAGTGGMLMGVRRWLSL